MGVTEAETIPPMMSLGGVSGRPRYWDRLRAMISRFVPQQLEWFEATYGQGPPEFPYWRDWGELMAAIAASELPYLAPEVPTFDATVSRGVFWKYWRPDLLVTNDIDERREADHRWDWFSEPVPAELVAKFGAAVFDPDFKLSGTNRIMLDRYGLDGDDPNLARMAKLFVGALATGETVEIGGYLLIKCQPQVASKRFHDQPRRVTNLLEGHGWEHVDTFIRQYRPVQQPPRSRADGERVVQEHARRNYSELTVMRKTADAVPDPQRQLVPTG
jgi:hypothetical protein